MIAADVLKIFILGTWAFALTAASTPILTHFLYKYKLGKQIRNSGGTPVFTDLHEKKRGTPTMGGILVWGTVLFTIFIFGTLSNLFPNSTIAKLDFFTRAETFLPIGAMAFSAIIGLVDDIWGIQGKGGRGDGIRFRYKILWYLIIGVLGALWFYFKLDWSTLAIPLFGGIEVGIWYIPIFIFIITATGISVNETDGLDGLAGGILACSYATFGAIAFAQGKFNLATLCAVIAGSLLAFLWFNIPPARFYMGDTGSMSLGVTLGVIAILTNSILLLPLVGIIFVSEAVSVIVQLLSRKLRSGKKIFKSAPLHHHLEAIGWTECKIVMRFWIISAVFSLIAVIIALLDLKIYFEL